MPSEIISSLSSLLFNYFEEELDVLVKFLHAKNFTPRSPKFFYDASNSRQFFFLFFSSKFMIIYTWEYSAVTDTSGFIAGLIKLLSLEETECPWIVFQWLNWEKRLDEWIFGEGLKSFGARTFLIEIYLRSFAKIAEKFCLFSF